MPMDEGLADRPNVRERRMFGGIGWTVQGHMKAGAHPDGRLMVRCSRDDYPTLVEEPGAGALEQGGRTMTGFVMDDREAFAEDAGLDRWLTRAHAFASEAPSK